MLIWYLLLGTSGVMLLAHIFRVGYAAYLRRTGVLPVRDQSSMDDVERLVAEGRNVWAMSVYRDLHPQVWLREAKQAVAQLEASS